ncbi:hypothetical protein [Streptomyces sp. SBT349]|uniref:hypothetical protein n=1 Tax=Streptomyces sp. SBT349 TaxID=1580539 RepID=UPI00131B08F5|nr:hypothetical protein [Streptomyces sp. SBT349]
MRSGIIRFGILITDSCPGIGTSRELSPVVRSSAVHPWITRSLGSWSTHTAGDP